MSDSPDSNTATSDDDSDTDLFDEQQRQQQRQRSRDQALYGVFYDVDDSRGGRGRNVGGDGRRRTKQDTFEAVPQFVKGKTTDETNDHIDNDDEAEELHEDEDDMFGQNKYDDKMVVEDEAVAADDENDEKETAEELAKREALQNRQKEADEYFLNLLKRGKGETKKGRRAPTSTFVSSNIQYADPSRTSARDLEASNYQQEQNLRFSETTQNTSDPVSSAPASAGLEMHIAAGLGVPTSFGGNAGGGVGRGLGFSQQLPNSKPSTFVKDPNLGSWEKHTRGIGMKLLAKMGYKGTGGLGSKRLKKRMVVDEKSGEKIEVEAPAKKGISRPVEVVVRPSNLGLGYGNFKEATKLKTNQQIEAEVRGIDLKKQKEKEESDKRKARENVAVAQKGTSSALPSVNDLMQQKLWKRGAKQSQTSRKRQKRTIIPYQELLKRNDSQGAVVIDMRGPSTTIPDESTSATEDGLPQAVPLAEELLHNMSLLLNTYENKIQSGSHFVRSTQRKVESIQSDIASMENRQSENAHRRKKLVTVVDVIDKIEAIVQESSGGEAKGGDEIMSKVQLLVRDLEHSLTEEERDKLRFYDVLAPSLLEPAIQARLDTWDPLSSNVESTNATMDAIINLCLGDEQNKEHGVIMLRTIFDTVLLPRVQHSLESQRWDPIRNVEIGLQVYESICRVAAHASSQTATSTSTFEDGTAQILPTEDAKDDSAQLKELLQEEIIHKTVYFKLARALGQWKPALDASGTGLRDLIHMWILPWLPHLDHRSILPTLLSDCKRKLKSGMSFLHKNIRDDDVYCRAALQTLRPWCNILSKETLPSLVSTSLVTRLAGCVATAASTGMTKKDDITCFGMDWKPIDLTMEMHAAYLLSDKEMLSVLEGELLSRWATRMHQWLMKNPSASKVAADIYIEWRLRLFSTKIVYNTTSPKCLAQDHGICTIFYAVLLMIQASNQLSKDLLNDYRPTPTSVLAVMARRTREEREKAQDELYRMDATGRAPGTKGTTLDSMELEARVRAAQHHQGHTPTFRQVVEAFAADQNFLFQPRMGHNSTIDGKAVFLFGKIPIYLDSDVVFAYRNSEWSPTSLGQLASMAQASE